MPKSSPRQVYCNGDRLRLYHAFRSVTLDYTNTNRYDALAAINAVSSATSLVCINNQDYFSPSQNGGQHRKRSAARIYEPGINGW